MSTMILPAVLGSLLALVPSLWGLRHYRLRDPFYI